MIYFQPDSSEDGDARESMNESRLILTTGDNIKLENKGIFFLRTTPTGKEINQDKIDSDVLFGEITPDTLKQLRSAINVILDSFIVNAKEGWGDCDDEQVDEFKKAAYKFEAELDSSITSLENSLEECKIDHARVSQIKAAGNNDRPVALTQYYEDLFNKWLTKFEAVVHATEDSMKAGKNDDGSGSGKDDGPDKELQWWRNRFQILTLYSELTKRNQDFETVKSYVLQNSGGEDKNLEKRWQQFENKLTEKLNEAKDNVKYLVTLEKFIKPLESGTPEEIMETLPALMNAIKMIHTIARYYKNSTKLTNLFIKITNAMINNCKDRILSCELSQSALKDPKRDDKKGLPPSIWDKDPSKLIEILESCIKLSHKYKEEYNNAKQKSSELPKTRTWDFDNNIIFSKFDKFIKRVRKLIEIFNIIKQFDALQKHKNLQGIAELTSNFKSKIDNFKSKNSDALDVDVTEFDRNYVELMQNINKLDENLQTFIDNNFNKFKIISYSLKLLKKLKGILKSSNIKNKLEGKYETILQNYGTEIDSIIKRFDEDRQAPPILRNMPGDAGKIIWVRHLFERLNGPI